MRRIVVKTARARRATGLLLAAGLHGVILALIAGQAVERHFEPPVYEVELVPPLLKTPPPELKPGLTPKAGAVRPALPVIDVHRPPPPPVEVIPLVAPVVTPAPPSEEPTVLSSGGTGGEGSGAGEGGGGPAGSRVRYRDPAWVRQPDPSRYYPAEAARERTEGQVVLSCRIRLDTRVTGCRIVAESPRWKGFGVAALRASRDFRVRPPERNGEPIADWEIEIPVEFRLASDATPGVGQG